MKTHEEPKQTATRAIPPSAESLLAWYDGWGRDLPWRVKGRASGERPDPYRVWLSEVMLQQTTVKTVEAYFHKFTQRWPRLADLADAPLEDVLEAWAGLGYYSRARNLHACAQALREHHGGRFPQEAAALKALPGIGAYTSAAIAAIAFDAPETVVDGNVERVIARLYTLEKPFPDGKKAVRPLAEKLTPQTRAGDYAQAIMDLGATVCTPRNPQCGRCPWQAGCGAYADGRQADYPRMAAKKPKPTRRGLVFWVTGAVGGQAAVLVRRRPPRGLLGGMLEFPSTPWSEVAAEAVFDPDRLSSAFPYDAPWQPAGPLVRHTFTHFHLELKALKAQWSREAEAFFGGTMMPVTDIEGKAFPTLMKKVARAVLAEDNAQTLFSLAQKGRQTLAGD